MKVATAVSKTELLDLYRHMKLIRVFEEACAQQYMRGKIRGFLHLYIGEEAIAAGAIPLMEPHDYVITHYRDHATPSRAGCTPTPRWPSCSGAPPAPPRARAAPCT